MLQKEWEKYTSSLFANELSVLTTALNSQTEALEELKKDNIELYNMAIQVGLEEKKIRVCKQSLRLCFRTQGLVSKIKAIMIKYLYQRLTRT
jgi:hypothetical protein